MLPDFMDIIWDCAELEKPVLTSDDMKRNASVFEDAGILSNPYYDEIAMCDSCDEGHAEKVVKENISGDSIKFYLFCPYGGGHVEIDPANLKRWSIRYERFAEIIASYLKCGGNVSEIIHDRLWNMGTSMIPLGGMRRRILLARKLRGTGAAEILSRLPEGRSALLFSIGSIPDGRIGDFDKERIFNLPDFLSWEDAAFVLNIDMVREQLEGTVKLIPQKKKPSAKQTTRATTASKLDREITQHILAARKYASFTYEKTGKAELLKSPTIQQLAERIEVDKSTISRILKDQSFPYTKILWETCSNIERIMEFKPRH